MSLYTRPPRYPFEHVSGCFIIAVNPFDPRCSTFVSLRLTKLMSGPQGHTNSMVCSMKIEAFTIQKFSMHAAVMPPSPPRSQEKVGSERYARSSQAEVFR